MFGTVDDTGADEVGNDVQVAGAGTENDDGDGVDRFGHDAQVACVGIESTMTKTVLKVL